MSDLIERLRLMSGPKELWEAADELDRLTRELALSKTDRGSLFARLCETEAQLAEALAAVRDARFCADYMASGMTHAPWMTEEARKRLARIDAFLAAAKEGER